QTVVTDPQGTKWIAAEREPVKVDVAEWNDYTVIARGNHLTHKVNGQVTAEVIDHDSNARALEGLLAFQIHRGPAMTVQIKDVMLKTLPPTPPDAFDQSQIPSN